MAVRRRAHRIKKGLMSPSSSNSFWVFIAGMALAGLVSGIAGAVATKMVNTTVDKAKQAMQT